MHMIDVLTKLREIAEKSPEEIGRAIAAAEAMSGRTTTVSEEMTEKQKKYFGGGKKDDKDEDKTASKGEKPDFADIDGDGDEKESMKQAAKDKEHKKVDEDIQITLSGSDAVLAEILKLAGQIGAKTVQNDTAVSSEPSIMPSVSSPPSSVGVPSSGPLPSLDKMMGIGSDIDSSSDEPIMDEPVMDGSYDATTKPNPVVMDMDAAVPSGDDLHKEKVTAPKVAPGDNPLHTAISFD